jgi:hypothetical protein
MADQKAVSRFIRISRLVFAGVLLLSSGLIFVAGWLPSQNPYLGIELFALMIGCFGIGGSGLLERWGKPAKK